MIRFVHIGSQISDGKDEFAFWDTVSDSFAIIGGLMVFESRKDFEQSCVNDARGGDFATSTGDYDRYRRLIPESYQDRKPPQCGYCGRLFTYSVDPRSGVVTRSCVCRDGK